MNINFGRSIFILTGLKPIPKHSWNSGGKTGLCLLAVLERHTLMLKGQPCIKRLARYAVCQSGTQSNLHALCVRYQG